MYVRPSADNRQRVKIPENYSGHAFRDSSPFGDMPPPTHIDTPPRRDKSERQTTTERMQYNELSTLPQDDSDDPNDILSPGLSSQSANLRENNDERSHASESEHSHKSVESQKSSIFSSLLPSATSGAKHFPFGHGIGSEEILILAIMLLVYLSGNDDECDNELLLLLGFLLFAG